MCHVVRTVDTHSKERHKGNREEGEGLPTETYVEKLSSNGRAGADGDRPGLAHAGRGEKHVSIEVEEHFFEELLDPNHPLAARQGSIGVLAPALGEEGQVAVLLHRHLGTVIPRRLSLVH